MSAVGMCKDDQFEIWKLKLCIFLHGPVSLILPGGETHQGIFEKFYWKKGCVELHFSITCGQHVVEVALEEVLDFSSFGIIFPNLSGKEEKNNAGCETPSDCGEDIDASGETLV